MALDSRSEEDELPVETIFRMCTSVADIVKSTLGPYGMNTMVVRSSGTPVVAKDSATIIDELNVDHPVYKIIDKIVESDRDEHIDPTVTVILLGELMTQARKLLERGVHPTTIIQGYARAQQRSLEELDQLAVETEIDHQSVQQILETQLESMVSESSEFVATLLVETLFDESTGDLRDHDTIYTHDIPGGAVTDSDALSGVCVEKRRPVNSAMSLPVTDTDVLLVTDTLELEELEYDVDVKIEDGERGNRFAEYEREKKRAIAETIVDLGKPVVFAQRRHNIDDRIQQFLANEGITAFHQVEYDVIDKLAELTGASKASNIHDVDRSDLGYATRVGRKDIGDEPSVFVETDDKTVTTIVLRGGSESVIDELHDAVDRCLKTVSILQDDPRVLPVGGASEIHLAETLEQHATSFESREQLVVQAYARALESIPKILADNAGMDTTDTHIALRNAHDAGTTAAGIDPFEQDISDMQELGHLEPLEYKRRSIETATDVTMSLLRIDDIFRKVDDDPAADVPGPEPGPEPELGPEPGAGPGPGPGPQMD